MQYWREDVAERVSTLTGVTMESRTRSEPARGAGQRAPSYLAQPIVYAADNGAQVVNISVAGKGLTKGRAGCGRLRHRQRRAAGGGGRP
jgi:hypothetical protein